MIRALTIPHTFVHFVLVRGASGCRGIPAPFSSFSQVLRAVSTIPHEAPRSPFPDRGFLREHVRTLGLLRTRRTGVRVCVCVRVSRFVRVGVHARSRRTRAIPQVIAFKLDFLRTEICKVATKVLVEENATLTRVAACARLHNQVSRGAPSSCWRSARTGLIAGSH